VHLLVVVVVKAEAEAEAEALAKAVVVPMASFYGKMVLMAELPIVYLILVL
jgi:hypothetical protein